RAAWPALDVGEARFGEYLGARSDADEAHAGDLYLACACVDKVPGAHEAFEAGPFHDACGALGAVNATPDRVEDAKQAVRRQLLDGALADYAGRGALRGWLKVTLTRELIRQVGGDKRQVRLDTGELANRVGGTDPETEYL